MIHHLELVVIFYRYLLSSAMISLAVFFGSIVFGDIAKNGTHKSWLLNGWNKGPNGNLVHHLHVIVRFLR